MKLLLLLTLVGCAGQQLPGQFSKVLVNRAKERCIPYGGFVSITKFYSPYDKRKTYYRAQCRKGKVYL